MRCFIQKVFCWGQLPSGNRSAKRIYKSGQTTTINATYYYRDASGNMMETETVVDVEGQANTKDFRKEYGIYGSSRVGYYRSKERVDYTDPVNPVTISLEGNELGNLKLGNKQYELSNHLGNVLTVISDRKMPLLDASNAPIVDQYGLIAVYLADVLSANDYYPFGLSMEGRKFENEAYRYGFNGKENDKDFGNKQVIQDYGFRLYNPSIARFLSVDPLTSSYPWYTPYQFAGNKVIQAIDLDGLEEKKKTADVGKTSDPALNPSNFVQTQSQSESPQWLSHKNEIQLTLEQQAQLDFAAKHEEYLNKKNPIYDKTQAAKLRDRQGAMFIEVVRFTLPIDLAEKLYKGEEVSNWEIAFEIVTAIPAAKLAGKLAKGAKFLIKKGDKVVDVTADVAKLAVKCACFLEGTLVKTDSGYTEIQDLQIGDLVWAFNENTQELELKEVTNTFIIQEPERIYYLHIKDEIIEVTGKHPFYIDGKWVEVQDLHVGDSVHLYSGENANIDSIRIEEGEYTVYNFSVDDFKTYYVSETGILVHNCDFEKALKAGKRVVGHTNVHFFVNGINLSGRPLSQMFKKGTDLKGVISESLDVLKNKPSQIISKGTSAEGHKEIILDLGRAVNETQSTNKVRIWLNAAGEISSIHPFL